MPTRTARALLIATAVGVVWGALSAPAVAQAEPVPAACPHLTAVRGDFDFVDSLPAEVPAAIRAVGWDCMLAAPLAPSYGVVQWQADVADAQYSEFLDLVDALFAAPDVLVESGTITASDGKLTTLDPGATAWPKEPSAGVTTATADFAPRDRSPEAADSWNIRVSWNARTDDASNWGWSWGAKPDAVDQAPFALSRSSREHSFVTVNLFRYLPPASATGISDPSTVSQLKTVLDAVPTPFQAIVLTITGALLTVFVGLPSALASGVLAARWERWFGWARRPTDAVRRVTARPQRPWVFWVGIVIASLIAAFVDPRFGLNWMSLRLYLTLFAAFAVFNVGAWLVIARVLRRLEPELPKPELRLRIGSLFVLLLGVLVSRLLALEPGIVFGIVAGLVFATTLIASRRASVVLVGTGFAAAAGVSAWILYSILTLAFSGVDSGITVGITEFFGGLTLQGLSALPIALLPFAVLDGGDLFRWNRPVWVAVYLGATVLFLLVLVNVPNGVTAVPGDFLRWVLLYFAFAVVATGIWGLDRLLERRREAARLPESEVSG